MRTSVYGFVQIVRSSLVLMTETGRRSSGRQVVALSELSRCMGDERMSGEDRQSLVIKD